MAPMDDDAIRGSAMHFEAVKVSMSQDKNGIILRLNVHPNDCPKELHTDWVGTRYIVAMVRLQDDGTVDDKKYQDVKAMMSSAALLCRNPDFYTFLSIRGLVDPNAGLELRENIARDAICFECGIASRSELKDNEEAREAFRALRQSFKNWKLGRQT